MKTKPITPYQRLLDAAKKFASAVEFRHTKLMWVYPKDKLGTGWDLKGLAERVAAADQLGYEVKLLNREGDLQVLYVKKAPDTPWEFK